MPNDLLFRVVVNARTQLALWPLGRPPPSGWHRTAMAGSRDQCCRYIDRLPPTPARIGAIYPPLIWPGSELAPGSSWGSATLIDRLGRWPDSAAALRDAHARLGFGELRRRSAAVMADLAAAGITDGERVMVCLPPGVDMVVALLGVLAAGGTAVPVAAGTPAWLRAAVSADAGASFLVANGTLRRLPAAREREHSAERGHPSERGRPADVQALVLYPHRPDHDQAAPHGVIWEHRQITALARTAEAATRGPFDRMVLPPTLGSLLLAAGLLWALGAGAEAVLDNERDDRRAGTVTLAGLPSADPSCYQAELRRSSQPPATLIGFAAAAGPAIIVPDPTGRTGPVRPLPGVRLLVLDQDLVAAAPGVPGRLYLAGWPVGGGYTGQPGLTARVLLPDPSGPPGSRMLDTGRTARQTQDGVVPE